MNNKKIGLYFIVTAAEKRRIKKNAALFGLKQSEYIRQRALGYAPKAVPPNAFYHFCEKIDALCEKNNLRQRQKDYAKEIYKLGKLQKKECADAKDELETGQNIIKRIDVFRGCELNTQRFLTALQAN